MSEVCTRGGGLGSGPLAAASAYRYRNHPKYRKKTLGFRIVVEPAVFRVVRGGSWLGAAGDMRSANRYGLGSDYRDDYLSFRLVVWP